jgi:aminomethyltransferase
VSNALQPVRRVRERAGLFALSTRAVIQVGGSDRWHWLDGMVTNDIEALAAAPPGSGCYALLLTREGRIVADLHVLALPDALLLELDRAAVAGALAHLEKYVVADDVLLADLSDSQARLALEGPRAADVLAAATGASLALAPETWQEIVLAGSAVRVAAWSFSGESGYQLFAPVDAAEEVRVALREAGRGLDLVDADETTLEILRIEAGTPRFARELDESVLPAEARLERAISTSKGCFLGQEVVTRLRARGRVNHLLVGLRFHGQAPPAEGAALRAGATQVGEVTSCAQSPDHGAIGLGFVRIAHSTPGTELDADGVATRVSDLPFFAHPPEDALT